MVTPTDKIHPVRIEEQMRTAYLDYAMSVIVARALPDVRDGLKPVQRRILYTMHEQGMRPNAAYRKCARVVGDVLGKYHPHGDAPVYEALVRLAQDFSLRAPVIDGQGNFGSVDGDPPAAMRYTECRMASIAEEMIADLDLNTVDFVANYDGSTEEPTVLPARLPNLLLNGASGIAVGMATNIPPHNLGELCDGIVLLIDNPDATVEDLIQKVPAPDFPTGGIIKNIEGVRNAYATGQGRVIIEARSTIEEMRGGRFQIVITELPYQINKATLVEKIAHLARDKKIDGISDIRDESSREGLRVVVELRRDAQPRVVMNNLYKHTAMRTSFAANMLALVEGQPQVLGLRRILELYIRHRQVVVRRRTEFLLKKAQDRAHILEGLRKAIDNLDLVIQIIRAANDVDEARNGLMARLALTEIQAQAILEMQLRRLTALDRQKLEDEYAELMTTIAGLQAILGDAVKLMAVIREETLKLKEDHADARRSEISMEGVDELSQEDLIPHQQVVVTLSSRGYIKRIPFDTYHVQRRGGKGVRGMTTREGDDIQHLEVADTHDTLLFFTNRGRVYHLRCFEIPADTSRTTRGAALVGYVQLSEDERVTTILPVPSLDINDRLLLATRMGEIKAIRLSSLANIRARGLAAMDLNKGDELVSVRLAGVAEDVIVVTASGKAIRFPTKEVPLRSRAAGGVRAARLEPKDRVVAMDNVIADGHLLVVSDKGFGKLTRLALYPRHHRGGKGVKTFNVRSTTGRVAAAQVVLNPENEELVVISARGQVVRVPLDEVSIKGRSTQGVTIWRDKEPEDTVASIAVPVKRDRDALLAEEEIAEVDESTEVSDEVEAAVISEEELQEETTDEEGPEEEV